MNDLIQELRQGDERVFDRLVDGELSDDQRRQLLCALDDEPGAWRRCALAFVEAQTWRNDFAALKSTSVRDNDSSEPRRRWHDNGWARGSLVWLAMAASFVIAFAAGLKFGNAPQTADALPNARQVADQTGPTVEHQTLKPDSTEAPPAMAEPIGDNRWQTVQLAIEGSQGVQQSVELPVVDATQVDSEWLEAQASAIPPHLFKALEQAGHRVRQQRQLWPIPLEDGRQLIVPVEQVEVQYLGGGSYQ